MHYSKRIFLPLIALVLLLSMPGVGLAQAGAPNNLSDLHMGFRGIPWGLSLTDVQGKGIKFGEFDSRGKAINSPVIGGTPLDVEGVPVRMGFTFLDGKFSGISIIPVDQLQSVKLVAIFMKQFGAPVMQDLKIQKHVWQDKKITILLQEVNKMVTLVIMDNELFAKAGTPPADYSGGGKTKP